jgi:hypothetical protein
VVIVVVDAVSGVDVAGAGSGFVTTGSGVVTGGVSAAGVSGTAGEQPAPSRMNEAHRIEISGLVFIVGRL